MLEKGKQRGAWVTKSSDHHSPGYNTFCWGISIAVVLVVCVKGGSLSVLAVCANGFTLYGTNGCCLVVSVE